MSLFFVWVSYAAFLWPLLLLLAVPRLLFIPFKLKAVGWVCNGQNTCRPFRAHLQILFGIYDYQSSMMQRAKLWRLVLIYRYRSFSGEKEGEAGGNDEA